MLNCLKPLERLEFCPLVTSRFAFGDREAAALRADLDATKGQSKLAAKNSRTNLAASLIRTLTAILGESAIGVLA
jgi:hypothetical protein